MIRLLGGLSPLASMGSVHVPVMVDEVLQYLSPQPGGTYVDGTLGGGGHSRALLEALQGRGRLIAIDRDQQAVKRSTRMLLKANVDSGPFTAVHGRFEDIDQIMDELAVSKVDGILFDLGVSSDQLQDPERGFSYQASGPLDMRMNRSQPTTAADIVNHWSQTKLAGAIAGYGEERWAERIAAFIVQERQRQPIRTTDQLVDVVKAALPASVRRKGGHPARRTFQALRIVVNQEIDPLEAAIESGVEHLKPEGRMVVLSFHSLEDRAVKQTFRRLNQDCICPPDLPVCRCNAEKQVELLTRSPVIATEEEQKQNSRSRSAKLRAVERC